jgi:hypothetical protein
LSAGDREDVEAVAYGYIDCIYQVAPERVAQITHVELAKRGFYWDRDGKMTEAKMDFAGLEKVARVFNGERKRDIEKLPRKVEVLDVQDQTASVKVYAAWGTDYMLLAKYDGNWKIVHVLWQGQRPKK